MSRKFVVDVEMVLGGERDRIHQQLMEVETETFEHALILNKAIGEFLSDLNVIRTVDGTSYSSNSFKITIRQLDLKRERG